MNKKLTEKINYLLEINVLTEEEASQLLSNVEINDEFDDERKQFAKEAISDICTKPNPSKSKRSQVFKKFENAVKNTKKGLANSVGKVAKVGQGINSGIEKGEITDHITTEKKIEIDCKDVKAISFDYSKKTRATFVFSKHNMIINQSNKDALTLEIDEEKVSLPIVVEKVDNELKIRLVSTSNKENRLSDEANLSITLPKKLEKLAISKKDNNIEFKDELNVNEINLSSSDGEIKFNTLKCSDMDINSVAGEVRFDLIECNNMVINSVSGNFIGKVLAGDLKFKGTGSDITIGKYEGSCKVNLVNGNILIKDLSGDAKIKTISGCAAITNMRLDNLLEFNSVSGNIALSPADKMKYNYRLTSNIGKVECNYEENVTKKTSKQFISEFQKDNFPNVKCSVTSGWISVK